MIFKIIHLQKNLPRGKFEASAVNCIGDRAGGLVGI